MRPTLSFPTRAWIAALIVGAALPPAHASSHREAPFIAGQPRVDGTDFYLFRSYEPGRADYITVIANYQPLQDAYGGPNYFAMDPNALYEIHLDNNGDAREDLTFQFRFRNTLKDLTVSAGGRGVSTPLVQNGPLAGVNPSALNVRETYTVDLVRGDRRTGQRSRLTNADSGAGEFDKPTDNIGQKVFGPGDGYAQYARSHVSNITIPGCAKPGRMFVGQRKDPFVIALGRFFDRINLDPLGPVDASGDKLADKNVTSLVLELPISCVATAGEPVIGGWTTASMRQGRLLDGAPTPGNNTAALNGGPWVQVSRLGMPLVNEVVIGLKDKDRFNAAKPVADGQFAGYVTNPTLPAIIESIFPAAPAPTKFPRQDLVVAFLTGVPGLNRPANVVASEMMRLNTSIAPVARGAQKNLGVLAGDAAGFPNGRRPGDDVIDIELRVAMGVLCTLNDPASFGCVPADAPAGAAPFTDGATVNDGFFDAAFPYLKTPLSGSPD